MEKITVSARGSRGGKPLFSVRVGGGSGASTHMVTVGEDYAKRFESRFRTPADLVEKSFRFLLSRESQGEILGTFDLADIQRYFRDYEQEVVKIK